VGPGTTGRPFPTAARSFCALAAAALLVTALAAPSRAQDDRLSKYQAQYAQETDLVRKSKLLGAMAPLQVDQSRDLFKAGNDEQSLDVLTHFVAEVQKTVAALKASGIDPAKRPGGFKELQIGLRVALRRLDDFVLEVPEEKRPWFDSARSDLTDAQNALIDDLFQTAKKHPDAAAHDAQPR
jgi:hypothetical protein